MNQIKYSFLFISFFLLQSCGISSADNNSENEVTGITENDTLSTEIDTNKEQTYSTDTNYCGYYFGVHENNWEPEIYTNDAYQDPDNLEEAIANETNNATLKQEFTVGDNRCVFEFLENGTVIKTDTIYKNISTLIWTDWAVMLTIYDAQESKVYSKKIAKELFYNIKLTEKDYFGNTTNTPKKDYYFESVVYSALYVQLIGTEITVNFDYYDAVDYGENGYSFKYKINLEDLSESKEAVVICSRCEGFLEP